MKVYINLLLSFFESGLNQLNQLFHGHRDRVILNTRTVNHWAEN